MVTYIYGLIDPRTGLIRYVGKSNNPKQRLMGHLSPKSLKYNTHKNCWLKELRKLELRPEMIILDCVLISEWENTEKFWISFLINNGLNLTNGNAGGVGNTGQTELTKSKISSRSLGNKYASGERSVQAKMNISKGRTGIKYSEEGRQKLSIAFKGRLISPETRIKIAKSCSKEYSLISPEGEVIEVKNLKDFAKLNGIPYSNLIGRGKSAGWKCMPK